MMENEKLNDLITYLLAESPELNSLTIPTNELEQFRLYRSLVNIRPAGKTSDEYLQIEDAFLQEMTQRKGITKISDLQPTENHIYLWKGDITTLQCGAIVNAANSGMTGCYHPCHNCIDNCIHTFAGVRFLLEHYHGSKHDSSFNDITCELLAFAVGAHHGLFDCIDENHASGFLHRLQSHDSEYQEAIKNAEMHLITRDEQINCFKPLAKR